MLICPVLAGRHLLGLQHIRHQMSPGGRQVAGGRKPLSHLWKESKEGCKKPTNSRKNSQRAGEGLVSPQGSSDGDHVSSGGFKHSWPLHKSGPHPPGPCLWCLLLIPLSSFPGAPGVRRPQRPAGRRLEQLPGRAELPCVYSAALSLFPPSRGGGGRGLGTGSQPNVAAPRCFSSPLGGGILFTKPSN